MKTKLLDAEKTRKRIKKLISQSREVKIGAYSVRRSGLSHFADELAELLENGGSLFLLIGYRSTPDIFDELRELEGANRVQIGLYDETVFHSKIYVFRLKDNSVISIIGSSNLTESALSTNIETNVEIQGFYKPEKLYDELFSASEKDRRTIEKRLKKWAEANRNVDKSEGRLERKARETVEGKKATRLWKALDNQLERVEDPALRRYLRLSWLNAERRIGTRFREKTTRNGKRAWLRKRLSFVMRKVILDSAKGLNSPGKARLFNAIIYYNLIDAEITKAHFSKGRLRALILLIKHRGLEKTFSMALWSSREHGRRLFRKIPWAL